MADEIPQLIARISEAVQDATMRQEEASEAAMQLRRVAERIENSAVSGDERPWWDDPQEAGSISDR